MAKRNRKTKASRFSQLPHTLLECPDYINLSGYAVKLLIELIKQYNGYNNGDLSLPFSYLVSRGFKSKATLHTKIKELVDADLIILTRTGGKNKANLYALTWIAIDECRSKLEIGPREALRNLAIERQNNWKKN